MNARESAVGDGARLTPAALGAIRSEERQFLLDEVSPKLIDLVRRIESFLGSGASEPWMEK